MYLSVLIHMHDSGCSCTCAQSFWKEYVAFCNWFLFSSSFFLSFSFTFTYVTCLWWFFLNSPGIMLLIFTKASSHVPLKILSIEDGTVLKSFNHLLHRNKKVDFIEQFNEKLLVKQENENLQILDVRVFIDIFLWQVLFPHSFLNWCGNTKK